MSTNIPLATTDDNVSLEEMEDRMEGILDARLSQTDRQTKESLAFTNFLHTCLPSLSEDIFSEYLTNVTAYTRKCMQLSRNVGSRQAEGSEVESQRQHRTTRQRRIPRVLFADVEDGSGTIPDVINASQYLPGPSFSN